MAQGFKDKYKKNKANQEVKKRKSCPAEEKDREKLDTTRKIRKQMQKNQKKIYSSIESSMISKAKGSRERFELI